MTKLEAGAPTTGPFEVGSRIVDRMRQASPPAKPLAAVARTSALAVLALAMVGLSGCGILDDSSSDDARPTVEVTEEIVTCDVATTESGAPPSIDLGAIVVGPIADAERVAVDGGTEITFAVEIDALDADEVPTGDRPLQASSLAILQARTAEDIAVLLSVDAVAEAGADRPGPASALSFERCIEPVRHTVTLLVTDPGCLVLVGNDPATGGFTELPVRVGVETCTATPPPAPIG